MMNYSPGDVVMVPFPFIDRPVQKLRPALVLSCSPDGEKNKHLVLAMITSARRSHWKSIVQDKRGSLSVLDLSRVRSGLKDIFKI
jgi:predicted alpha/beta-fold hydrolase